MKNTKDDKKVNNKVNNKANNKANKKIEEKYRCKVCGKILQKKGNICHKCFKELNEYREKNGKNELLEAIKEKQLEELSNDEMKITKKVDKDTKLLNLEISFKYYYLRDNILKYFDFALITLVIFLGILSILPNNNLIPLAVIVYAFLIYIKHIYIKNIRENTKLYFFENRIVKKTYFPFFSVKTLKYDELKDIKEYKRYAISKRRTLIFQSVKTKKLNNHNIEIDDIKNLDEIIPLIIGITGYTIPKEEDMDYKKILKDTFNNVSNTIMKDKNNNGKKSTSSKRKK